MSADRHYQPTLLGDGGRQGGQQWWRSHCGYRRCLALRNLQFGVYVPTFWSTLWLVI